MSKIRDAFSWVFVVVLLSACSGPGEETGIVLSAIEGDVDSPSIGSVHTQRSEDIIDVTGVVTDPLSAVSAVQLSATVDGASQPATAMDLLDGATYGATMTGISAAKTVALTMSAADSEGNSSSVSVPVANGGGDRVVECQNPFGAVVQFDGSRSTGNGLSYLWGSLFGTASGVTTTQTLGLGPFTVVLLTVTDANAFTSQHLSHVKVADTTGPTFSVHAEPSCIWPPNRRLAPYELGSNLPYTVADLCDPNPSVRIINVSSSDGTPVPFSDSRTCLRATRAGGGDHVYTLTLEAADLWGNTTQRSTTVTVPGTRSPGCATASGADDDALCQF